MKKDGVDAFGLGFGFLLFCGLLGLLGLLLHLSSSPELFEQTSLSDLFFPLLIGFFTSAGIVFTNIAGGIGVAGISNSISHQQLILVTVFNYFIFGQNISGMQCLGIMLTAIGGITVALEDKIMKALS
jgi:drug/metabolite transporter (DMT)-like permease